MPDFLFRTSHARRYAVCRPPGYTTRRKWPLILFLHGAGESGDDGVRQTKVGIGPALEQYPERYPALVVLPQCPLQGYWRRDTLKGAVAALDETIAAESVDEKRVYLTGISMGGFGSYLLATLEPDRFAAIAPICGGGQPRAMAPMLARIPLWIFHGALDSVVPVQYSREMVKAIRAANPVELRYTEYPDVDHNSWDAAYAEPELPSWMLSQRLNRPTRRPVT